MIDGCARAGVKLMIAYRCRYQPHHLELIRRAQSGALGPVKLIEAINAQNQGDPSQWRLRKAMAGGGALLREKIVAAASARMVVITDGSKLVKTLGRYPLPVEVVEYGHATTVRKIAAVASALGYPAIPITQRMKDGALYKTDGGNLIYDCGFAAIPDAAKLAAALSAITGVVEHGLFVGLATTLLIAREDGVQVIEKPS